MRSQVHPTALPSDDRHGLELWEPWGSERQVTAYDIDFSGYTWSLCNLITVGTQLKVV